MTRSPDADKMHKALKQIVVPYLRQQGFKGTFPHFRRLTETKIDLLSFQFRIQGGGFFIDLASSTLDGFVDGSGNLVPPNKLNAYYGIFNGTSHRLSPTDSSDYEFIYRPEPGLEDRYLKYAQFASVYYGDDNSKYERIATDVLTLIQEKADNVFKTLIPALRIAPAKTENLSED